MKKDNVIRLEEEMNFFSTAQKFLDEVLPEKKFEKDVIEFMNKHNFNFNEDLLFRQMLSEALQFRLSIAHLKREMNNSPEK